MYLVRRVRLWCNDGGLLPAAVFRSFGQSRGMLDLGTKGNPIMRKLMIVAAIVSTALTTPAAARDGAPYVGIDAGLLRPSPLNLRLTSTPLTVENALRIRHKIGFDGDAVFGYDFGMFRVEGELGYKYAKLNRATAARSAVNAYAGSSFPIDYPANGHGRVISGMLNGLVDFGPSDGVNLSIGAGVGGAKAKYNLGLVPSTALNFTGSANGFAWQLLAELRAPLSGNVDAGVKYRYFETQDLDFGPFCRTTCAVPPYDLHGRYKAMSFMGSLTYNFWSPPPPPPAPERG
jgi:opacity protein-like surface antigen